MKARRSPNRAPRPALPGEKWCSLCSTLKPVENFHKRADRRSGLQTVCKPCSNARRKAHKLARPDLRKANSARNNAKQRREFYQTCCPVSTGLDLIPRLIVDAWRASVGPYCQCCGRGNKLLFIDHMHYAPFFVRGLICRRCNKMLQDKHLSIVTRNSVLAVYGADYLLRTEAPDYSAALNAYLRGESSVIPALTPPAVLHFHKSP